MTGLALEIHAHDFAQLPTLTTAESQFSEGAWNIPRQSVVREGGGVPESETSVSRSSVSAAASTSEIPSCDRRNNAYNSRNCSLFCSCASSSCTACRFRCNL